jgi:hypothetical protein
MLVSRFSSIGFSGNDGSQAIIVAIYLVRRRAENAIWPAAPAGPLLHSTLRDVRE